MVIGDHCVCKRSSDLGILWSNERGKRKGTPFFETFSHFAPCSKIDGKCFCREVSISCAISYLPCTGIFNLDQDIRFNDCMFLLSVIRVLLISWRWEQDPW